MMADKKGMVKYLRNPDVVLREEDPDGGLLFNPDTNQVRVLNKTGLFIWKLCEKNCDIDRFVTELVDNFQNVPEKETREQVENFIGEMVSNGFIGELMK